MRHRNGRVELMSPANEPPELGERLPPVRRLGKKLLTKRERLVSAYNIMSKPSRRNPQRLLARQASGDLTRLFQARLLLDGAFVDVGGNRLEFYAGIFEQHFPRAALRREDQGMLSAPERHSACRCRWRSVYSFSTSAAVSSIDRRVTSSCGQLNFALRRLAKATSSATAWRSI